MSVSQLTLLLVHVWSFGRASSGRSRLQVVTSISSGKSSCSKVKGVPQSGQKLRVAADVDLNRVGSPQTSRNSDRDTLNHATNGAPDVLRQIEQ